MKCFSRMKRTFAFLLCGVLSVVLLGNDNTGVSLSTLANDSVEKELLVTDLEEFVVKADNAYIKNGVLNIVPTSKEKEAALDGNELLRFLQIPVLVYDFVGKKINHISGNLAIYINGEPANDVEIQNLKATDVTRVEYMDFPVDPRFGHNPHVVNFVVRKYLYGGYTRLNTSENINKFSNYTTLYSKFSVKNLTFDAYVSYLGYDSADEKDNKTTIYNFGNNTGSPQLLKVESQLIDDRHRANNLPISFRVNYSNSKILISNTIGYKFSGVPEKFDSYNTVYSGVYNSSTSSSSGQKSHSNDISWSGNYRFFLPKNYFIQVSPTFTHSHINTRNFAYSGLENSEEVLNYNLENNYLASCNVYINKFFNARHSVYLSAQYSKNWYNIDYYGSTEAESNERSSYFNTILGYCFNSGPLSLVIAGGYVNLYRKSGTYVTNENSPFFGISGYYNPTNKHSFSINATYENHVPGPTEMGTEVVKVNEFMYMTGDPNIRDTKSFRTYLNWMWLPNNLFRIGVSGSYSGSYKGVVAVFMPYGNETALLRKTINNGNTHNGNLYVNLGLNNIADCLSFTLSPSLNVYNQTGIYKKTLVRFEYRASVDCLLKNGFSLYANFYGPRKFYQVGQTVESSFSYNIGGRWSWKGLKIGLELRNIFGGKDWNSKWLFDSDYYSYSTIRQTKHTLYNVDLSLSYTFSYGKKKLINSDEINAIEGVGSGAMGL